MFIVGKMTPLRHCILIPVENINVLGKQGEILDTYYKFYAL